MNTPQQNSQKKDNDKVLPEIYDHFAIEYLPYADGNVDQDLFDFVGRQYGFADTKMWKTICNVFDDALTKKQSSPLSVLDIGCGPGTWLLRLMATYPDHIGEAIGLDKSRSLLELAQQLHEHFCTTHTGQYPPLQFDFGDITKPLPFADNTFDVTLCINTVLNHLPVTSLPFAIQEICRVTRGKSIVSVRSIGGLPTAYVCELTDIVSYYLDNDILKFHHKTGYIGELQSNLITREELVRHFEAHDQVTTCFGLDILPSRFLPDERWAPKRASRLPGYESIHNQILEWEAQIDSDPMWIDFANHIVLTSSKNDK